METAPPAADPYAGFSSQWGGYTDAETGLVLMGHRYYDPAQGRFLTRDPIGYAGGLNLYRYCANSPVMGIDPLGLFDIKIGPSDRPWMDFTNDVVSDGLYVGINGTLSGISGGLYDGGDARCDPSFATSAMLAGIGRDLLVTAGTMGLGEAWAGPETELFVIWEFPCRAIASKSAV